MSASQNTQSAVAGAGASGSAGNSTLADMNSATLGAKFPEIALPDGKVVQTGTVGAMLLNIRAYNKAHAAGDTAQL
ncbi:hypothetical protein F4777DRAFT_578463 [Nemania sp. FL0916]|nr:hypothetical protein F4777DRAFT_578463 [Nemania sp. FL0916]